MQRWMALSSSLEQDEVARRREGGAHHAPAQRIQRRRARKTGDLHILEAMVGEARFPHLHAVAFEDIAVGLAIAAFDKDVDVGLVDVPIIVQLFRVAQGDFRAGRAAHASIAPSR